MKSLLIAAILVSLLIVALPKPVNSQSTDATSSAAEQIVDTVKERIQATVRNQAGQFSSTTAFVGELETRTTNTLSIFTKDGVRLASASATTHITNNSQNEVELEELSIGDHITALGHLNNEGVLDTQRIIINSSNPQESITNHSFFGYITEINPEDNQITLVNHFLNQEFIFTINSQSFLEGTSNNQRFEIDFESIEPNQPALAIFKPGNTNQPETLNSLLTRTSFPPQPTPDPTSSDDDLEL